MEGSKPVRIGSRALEILLALVERSGELVGKEELRARVWPETFVEESNLKVNVAALRRTLGDGRGGVRYIETVSGRGYRFVSPVQILGDDAATHNDAPARLRAHNLPIPATRVLGRGQASDAILSMCEGARLVTVVGAAGIGKTTVALAVAARMAETIEHDVRLVDLAPVTDSALVPSAIAAAIGLTVHSADERSALRMFLRDRRLMLVLDNCEHIIDAAAICVRDILAAAAGVRILATSREALRAEGEMVYRLPPLETPPDSHELMAAEALAFPAVELFVERATATLNAFSLDDANAPAVSEICRKLDGVALAIELAATRIDAFQVREILALLDDRFRMLKGRRDAPGRHQSLSATLDWSHDLLSESERMILRRLAVFAGTFSLESACALAVDGDLDRTDLVEGLASLVAKSLLSVDARGAASHYRFLDTTRGYALQKLAEAGERDRLRRRHAEHMLDLAAQAEAEWHTRPAPEWIGDHRRQLDDIRLALNWAFTDQHDIPIGVALTAAAIPLWEHLSLVGECRACVERALAHSDVGSLREHDEMKLRMALGTALLHTRGPVPPVRSAWVQALDLAERLDDGEYQLRCLWGLCDYHTWIGDHRTALVIANRISAIASARDDRPATINVERQIGTALRYLGDLAEARSHLERTIRQYVPPAVRAETARFQLDPRLAASGTLANVLWLQGYPDQAARMAEQQLVGAQKADHALALCNALVHTACPLALLVGDLPGAERLLAMIEDHVARHAMTVWSAMGRCLRGEWLLESGEIAGLDILRHTLAELSDMGFVMRRPYYLGILAKEFGVHGEIDAAHVTIEEALTLSRVQGEVWCMPELLRIKGDLMRLSGPAETTHAVETPYLESLELARHQGALSWELRSATSLADLWHYSGGSEPAKSLLSSTYERFEEGFETRDLLRARALLDDLRGACDKRPMTTVVTLLTSHPSGSTSRRKS